MNVFTKTLTEIISLLKPYIDKYKCLVCKDVIQAQSEGRDRAAGIEDSAHKEGFVLVTMWLLGREIPNWLDYNCHFAQKDTIINEKVHKKGEILRGPPFFNFSSLTSIIGKPPMPEPIATPTLSALFSVISRPESLSASSAATRP